MALEEDIRSYLIGNLKGNKDYADALSLVEQQLGRAIPHVYKVDETTQLGAFAFKTPVEIDSHPLQKTGYTVSILPPLKQPNL